jgi:hypothetical protein
MASKSKVNASKRNERLQLTVGAIGVAKDARGFLSGLIGLQRALDGGGARAQKREVERLLKKYGDDHPRVREAQARIDALQRHGAHFDRGLDGLSKAVETLAAENLFHGYVVDAEGAPARGYRVHLDDRNPYSAPLRAMTDDDGYFRIELGKGQEGHDGGDRYRGGLNSMLRARMGRFTPGFESVAGQAASAATGAGAAAAAATESPKAGATARKRAAPAAAPAPEAQAAPEAAAVGQAPIELAVRIDDPTGKQVYEDGIPLLYEPGRSIFRYYALS